MLFKTISKKEFRKFVDYLLELHEVIGPKRLGTNREGKAIHQYLPVDSFDEIDFSYEKTQYSAKTYFLPFKENLSVYHFSDEDWEQEIQYRIKPRAIVGLHACDINALNYLDRTFNKDFFPSPYYISRRQNTFIVGIDHFPPEDCFCQSVGHDTVTHGFDLFLTDIGKEYFVCINSDRGFMALQHVKTNEITDANRMDYLAVRKEIQNGFKNKIHVQNLPNLMDISFDAKVWHDWGDKCLSCGSCSMACPTCYCYGVSERVSMDFTEGQKVKHLYSCNIRDFAEVAGGHNFRPSPVTRLKYHYYHQHRGLAFAGSFDEPKCVGCNRCGRVCLAGINPPDVIRDLQVEKEV